MPAYPPPEKNRDAKVRPCIAANHFCANLYNFRSPDFCITLFVGSGVTRKYRSVGNPNLQSENRKLKYRPHTSRSIYPSPHNFIFTCQRPCRILAGPILKQVYTCAKCRSSAKEPVQRSVASRHENSNASPAAHESTRRRDSRWAAGWIHSVSCAEIASTLRLLEGPRSSVSCCGLRSRPKNPV
jgi:hypothetical protein